MFLLYELLLLLSWEQLLTCICTHLFVVTMGTTFLLANLDICLKKGILSKVRVAKTYVSLRKRKHISLVKWASAVRDSYICNNLIVLKLLQIS